MNNSKPVFEVIYTPLEAGLTPFEGAVIVTRATQAMASSRFLREAEAPVFFKRLVGGRFSLRSSSFEVLEQLPVSYGSAVGHFGIFERGEVHVAGRFHAVYTIAAAFASYTMQTRRRLTAEVGQRLAAHLQSLGVDAEVSVLTVAEAILVVSSLESAIDKLPARFNAVFVRSLVQIG